MNVYWNHTLVLLLALFSPPLSPTFLRADVLDADINFHVTDALLTDSRVSASAITATTTDGVAALEGDLNTWKERQESGFLALHTSGISEVDNRLTVKGVAYPWDEHHYKLTGF